MVFTAGRRSTSRALFRCFASFAVLALVFTPQRLGLELVPVAFDVLKPAGNAVSMFALVELVAVVDLLYYLPWGRFLGGEVGVLENVGGAWPLSGIVAKHLDHEVKGCWRQSVLVLVLEYVRFPNIWP